MCDWMNSITVVCFTSVRDGKCDVRPLEYIITVASTMKCRQLSLVHRACAKSKNNTYKDNVFRSSEEGSAARWSCCVSLAFSAVTALYLQLQMLP